MGDAEVGGSEGVVAWATSVEEEGVASDEMEQPEGGIAGSASTTGLRGHTSENLLTREAVDSMHVRMCLSEGSASGW